jgi:hypothetical protein
MRRIFLCGFATGLAALSLSALPALSDDSGQTMSMSLTYTATS